MRFDGGLRNLLLKRLSPPPSIFAILPFIPQPELLNRLDWSFLESYGGWQSVDQSYADDEAAFIRDFLLRNPANIALFQLECFRLNRWPEVNLAEGEQIIVCPRTPESELN